jgi:acetyl-CoA synthetase (ADP-forming)
MREADFPYLDRVGDALGVLRALEAEAAGRDRGAPPMAERPAGAGPLPDRLGEGLLTEPETKRLVAAYGIPVNREAPVQDAEAAVEAARAIGYPVALKGVRRGAIHKSELGLVRLNLPDAGALRAAAAAMPADLDGLLVAEMVRGEAELFLGARHDTEFGPMVLVGAGGTLVELFGDVQLAPAPLAAADALALLRRLRCWPVLAGMRGRPVADVAAAAEALVRLSWLAAELGPRLLELDLNPLILRAAGQGAAAVDGRATLGPC